MLIFCDYKIGMSLVDSKQNSQTYLLEHINIDVLVASEISREVQYFFDENHEAVDIEFYYFR